MEHLKLLLPMEDDGVRCDVDINALNLSNESIPVLPSGLGLFGERVVQTEHAHTYKLGPNSRLVTSSLPAETALQLACEFGKFDMVRWLLKSGADPAVHEKYTYHHREGHVVKDILKHVRKYATWRDTSYLLASSQTIKNEKSHLYYLGVCLDNISNLMHPDL